MPLKERPRLLITLPGALMYQVEQQHGFAIGELDVARQVRCLASASPFAGIPTAQRDVLLESITKTIGRANYHFERFRAHRRHLDELRAWAPGEVFFDDAATTMHYELQAMAGAARLLVDELLFIVAIRYGTAAWEPSAVLRKPIAPGSSADRSEIHRLRTHLPWFDVLNAYRNTFFHSGWSHGSGHFDLDGRRAAESPEMNALLVPDRGSLARGNRAYDWTYNDGTTVDDIAECIHGGMIAMVDDMCAKEWATPVPPPGTMASDQFPTVMVSLPVPMVVARGDSLLVPLFSSRERAMDFLRHAPSLSQRIDSGDLELTEVKSNPDVVRDQEVISLSFTHFGPDQAGKTLHVCVDPVPRDGSWSHVDAAGSLEVPVDELLEDKIRIVSIAVEAPTTSYVWRMPLLRP
jgi:hypothetical protein